MDTLLTTEACTLPSVDRPLRLAEFDALFADAVHRVERDADVVRLHLTGGSDLRERVADLTARETACCSFFSFVLDGEDGDDNDGGPLTLTVSVPAARRDLLDALADRAVELSS